MLLLLLLQFLVRPRCGRRWLQEMSQHTSPDTLQATSRNAPWHPRSRRAAFQFRPVPRRRPPGRARYFPDHASRCLALLRKHEFLMKRLPQPCGPRLGPVFPVCRRRLVPRPVPPLRRPRRLCRELPWAAAVRFGLPQNRILQDSRPRAPLFHRARIWLRN